MDCIIKATNRCNFQCAYCSVGSPREKSDLSLNMMLRFIDQLPELLELLSREDVAFLWHGGEPLLLSPKYYEQAISYALEKLQCYNVRFKLQTNGYLIDNEWIELFKKYNISVGVSVDGPATVHDHVRVFRGGLPTHSVIMDNINLMRNSGISVSALMVASRAMQNKCSDVVKFFKENGLGCKIKPLVPCGNAVNRVDLQVSAIEYASYMKAIFREWIDTDTDIVIEPLYSFLISFLYDRPMAECSYNGSCGKGFICLNNDGIVYPCGRYSGVNEFAYGNVCIDSLVKMYESTVSQRLRARSAFLQMSRCGSCEFYRYCNGGCSFEAFLSTGQIEAATMFCEAYKDLLYFLRTQGLIDFKRRLLKERQKLLQRVSENKKGLELLREYAL